MSKKVTIVLPVYNGEAHITEALQSIILQSYQNWELIIVNDCSTDNTLKICENIAKADKRITIVSNANNLKLPNTLNVGFKRATGDYYTWTSDDNMYKPNALEVLVRTLNQNPDIVMVYSDYTNIDSDGHEIGRGILPEPRYIGSSNVCGACFMYTAEVAKQVGIYDPNLFLAEDYDYWIRIYKYGKMLHIGDDLYLYRRHAGSLTETKKASINEQTYKTLEKNFLSLYVDAKQNKMHYAFFDHMIRRGEIYKDEIQRKLVSVDRKYLYYLMLRKLKRRIKAASLFMLLKRAE